MPRNLNTIMHIFMKSVTWFYRFLMLEVMILIQEDSWRCQEYNGIVVLPWNLLKIGKQFWNFLQKIQSLFMAWAQLPGSWALGFASDLYEEWIRVEISTKNLCIQCFWDLISMDLFQSFPCPFDINHGQIFPNWLCTKSWSYDRPISCIKRFKMHAWVFLSYFI